MANERIRKALKESGMAMWQLADLCGISECTISRWFRKELPDETQKKMLSMISAHSSVNPKELDVLRRAPGRPTKNTLISSYEKGDKKK